MKVNSRFKSLISILVCIVLIFTAAVGCSTNTSPESDTTSVPETTSEYNEVTVSNETKELVSNTLEEIEQGNDISTNEVIESSEEEEATVVDEGVLEADAQVEQENVSYDGTNAGDGLSLLGDYQGLTYYNQADSRWANILYTSTGNRSQTMKSSGCGPTAAAMIVSSSKGAILPTTMAQLFVDNGYRTSGNGTAWAAFPFVADYFGFDEYRTTTSFNTMRGYLTSDDDNDGIADYFVVASCNSGLWTTGGHYIVLVGDDDGTIAVYDPYLYRGKYNTASRRAANVVVSGNSAFVSESNFQRYSNVKQYWIFSNDNGDGNTSDSSSSSGSNTPTVRYSTTIGDTYKLKSSTTLYSKGNLTGTRYQYLAKTTVKVIEHYSSTVDYIYVPATGRYAYCPVSKFTSTGSSSSSSTNSNYRSSVGNTYKLKSNTVLYSKGNLTGTQYQYLKNTTIKVLSHYSSTVDYIYVVYTGRYAYCPVSAFTSNSSGSSSRSTVGKYFRLKSRTTLYSKSNLSGTQYQYLPLTQVKVLQNVSNSVDYVQVVKTGRRAYVRTSAYK